MGNREYGDVDHNANTSHPPSPNLRGNWNSIGGGATNRILFANYASILGGENNTILTNANEAAIGGGTSNLIANGAADATISGGLQNIIQTNAPYGTIPGGQKALAMSYAQLAYAGGAFASPGDAQSSLYVLRGLTTPANNGNALYLDGVAAEIALPPHRACTFTLRVMGLNSAHQCYGFHLRGAANGSGGEDDSVASGPTPGTPEEYLNQLGIPPGNQPTVSVSGGKLHVQVNGNGIDTIRWTATVEITEVAW